MQIVDIFDFTTKLNTNEWFEELEDESNELGWMDEIEIFQIFLILPIQSFVCRP